MADPTSNPILSELSNLSPGAQQALTQIHQSALNAKDTATPPPPPNLSGMPVASMPSLQAPSSSNVSMAPPPTVAPPARGTLAGDQAERSRLLSTGSGISQIHSKIEDAMPNHPTLGKILGWGAQIPAQIGEVAGSMFGPTRTAEMLTPGTEAHHLMELRNLNSTIGKESEEGLKGAQTAEIGANTAKTAAETAGLPQSESDKHELEQATVGNLKSEATDRDNAQNNPPLATAYAHAVSQAIKEGRDPAQDPIVQHLSDAITSLQPGQNKVTEGHPVNVMGPNGKPMVATFHPDTGKTTDSTGKELLNPQPYERPQNTNVNMGTWALGEDPTSGKPIMFNSKTGEVKDAPQGMAKAGTFEKKNEKTANIIQSAAMAHQLQNEAENGNAEADPALALAFFKAIKGPDGQGIRFTNTENNLIMGARNSAGDLEAIGQKVLGGGQKFTTAQRQNIVKIIDMYAQAAQRSESGGAQGSSGSSPKEGDTKVNSTGDHMKYTGGRWGPA